MAHPVTEFLLQRNSSPRLSQPAPSSKQLETIFNAALRAPDHAMLRPWRYLVIQGAGLEELGEIYATSAIAADTQLSHEQQDKFRKMPHRAPMVIVAIAKLQEHAKVPEIEQVISTGVGVGYLLLALQAEGFGGMWRTGPLAYSDHVCRGLGLADNEKIVGFLYVGTPEGKAKPLPQHNVDDFVSHWP